MVGYAFLAVAGMAVALPLNINLGAYSPALVVGDGEISFGGNQDVSSLMNALEGAAVSAAAGQANAAVVVPAANTQPEAPPPAAEVPVTAAAAAADPALQEQIAALQGMGRKEIEPRQPEEAASAVAKRDLSGFDRALKFAEAALVKGPKVQLGTGEGGSGVGIIVDNNQEAAARPGTGTEGEGAAVVAQPAGEAKRDLSSLPAAKPLRAKVTTMYVRSGIPASLQQRSSESTMAVRSAPEAASVSVSRRDTIDAVNLNVDGNQGLTMTFVETLADDE